MLQPELLAFVRCPEDHSALAPVDEEFVDAINAAIRAGRLLNRAGRAVDQIIDGGLMRARGDLLYPIVDGIPILLREEAIPVDQLRSAADN